MEMHTDFGVWMKAIDPSEDLDRLTKRWDGLVAVISECAVDLVDHLTRRHFGLSDGDNDTKEWFEPCLSGCNPHPLYVGCAVIRQARVSEWKLMF